MSLSLTEGVPRSRIALFYRLCQTMNDVVVHRYRSYLFHYNEVFYPNSEYKNLFLNLFLIRKKKQPD